jgi:hypothetical protein
MSEVLETFLPPSLKSGEDEYGTLFRPHYVADHIFNTNTILKKELVPSLLKLFANVEHGARGQVISFILRMSPSQITLLFVVL